MGSLAYTWNHTQWMAHSQVHLRFPFDFLARNKFQFEASRQRGDVGVHFHQRKMLAYASARTEPEGQVGEPADPLYARYNNVDYVYAGRMRKIKFTDARLQ